MKLKQIFFGILLTLAFLPSLAFAHENYVLTKPEISADLAVTGINVFSPLKDPADLPVAVAVALGSLIAIALYFWFQNSLAGRILDAWLKRLEPFGHIVLRTALALSLLASAQFNVFLGPEIPLTSIPFAFILKPALYILGTLMLLGLWSEFTGAASLIILLLATWVYKDYMATYFNYLGEFLALLLFGSRTFSLDKLIYKTKEWAEKKHDWEIFLIRVTYGVSIMYPAITYKLIHPEVIIDIVNRYHLTQFHWLFPHDPLLISLGSGLAQIAVGLCLIFGFETRLNTLVTFILMMLSVLFFKETVWPHFILLALALYLMINNGGKIGLDDWLHKKIQTARHLPVT